MLYQTVHPCPNCGKPRLYTTIADAHDPAHYGSWEPCTNCAKVSRPDWDTYWFAQAELAATRGTCLRAKVGAVIVEPVEHRLLSQGYNGAPAGEPHCLDVGCDVVDDHCQRALHAEVNAIAWAAKHGISIRGATIYVQGGRDLCRECAKVLKAIGITDWRQSKDPYLRGLMEMLS